VGEKRGEQIDEKEEVEIEEVTTNCAEEVRERRWKRGGWRGEEES